MGRLDIRICAARNLVGKPDPYVVVKLENQTYRTGACKDTSNPTWNEVFKFQIADPNSSQLKFELWNKNIIADEFLGQYSLSCSGLLRGQVKDEWHILQQCKTNAELHIRVLAHDFGVEMPNIIAPPPNAMEYPGFYGSPTQGPQPVVGTPVAPQSSPVPLQGSGTFSKEGYAVQPAASGTYAAQPGTPASPGGPVQPQRQFAQPGQQVPAYAQQQMQQPQPQQFVQRQQQPQSPQVGYPPQGSPMVQQQQQPAYAQQVAVQQQQPQQQFAQQPQQPQQQFMQQQQQQPQAQQQFAQPQQQFMQQQQPQQQLGYPQQGSPVAVQQQQQGYPQQQAMYQQGYPASPQLAQRGPGMQAGYAPAPGVPVYQQQVTSYPGSPYGIQTTYPQQAGFGSPYGTAYVPPASLAAMQAAEMRAERRILQAERNAIVGAEMAMLGGGMVGAEMAMMGMGGYGGGLVGAEMAMMGMGGYGAGVVGAEMAMMGMGGLAGDVIATDMMLMNGGGMMW